jgi:rare lipoprotein A
MMIRPAHVALLSLAFSMGAYAQTAATDAALAAAAAPAATAGAGVETGKLAWYGRKFQGRKTASGERFDAGKMTMAHKTLPFGTKVKVTNPANGESVVLRVNDRGPAQADRVGDVSEAAARTLGMRKSGVIDAQLEVVESR